MSAQSAGELTDLGDGCYAWVTPPGCWGFANSGIVVDGDQGLVVDTQNDMPMARALSEQIDGLPGGPRVDQVVNTHGDGDHWNGNVLYPDATIISSEATLADIRGHWLDPTKVGAYAGGDSAFAEFMRWRVAVFNYDGWVAVHPNKTYVGDMSLDVGASRIELYQLGPAHTTGDTVVWVPDAGVLYSGDLLFTASTPIMWAGPLSRCIEACDRMLAFEPRMVVPGHGPLITANGITPIRDYLAYILDYATTTFGEGKSPRQAYDELDFGRWADWPHASRTFQNINLVYRELDPARFTSDVRAILEFVYDEDQGDWRAIRPATT